MKRVLTGRVILLGLAASFLAMSVGYPDWHSDVEELGVYAYLSISGNCPGAVTLDVSGATPNGVVVLAWSKDEGTFVVPRGACSGTELALDQPKILTSVMADANGDASLARNAPQGACGVFMQTVDRSSCGAGNVAQVP